MSDILNFASQPDFFAFGVLVVAFVLYAIFWLLSRRGIVRPHLRRLSAYEAVDGQVGAAVESGGRVHVSLAGNSIVDEGTATALAGLEMLEAVSERTGASDRPALGTTADPTTLPLVGDAIRHATLRQEVQGTLDRTAARLVAFDTTALAAGVTGLVRDENLTANILAGSFEREAILITEAGARNGLSQTVASDRPEGQAVAFAAADHPLIGEELYVAQAYLSGKATRTGGLLAQDVVRWLIILAIVAVVVQRTLGG